MEVLKLETWTGMFSPDELVPDKVQEYLDFVVQAVERYDPCRYSEWHHVMPKCIDQGKYRDQGVRINGADHFRAHMKLVECFSGEKKSRLSYALMRMKTQTESNGEEISEDDYEIARNLVSQASSILMSEIMKGNKSFLGHHHSDETKKKLSEIKSGVPLSDSHRKKLSESHKGKKYTQSQIESRKDLFKGERNPMYGKHLSEDHKRKLSESHTNPSEETRKRLSDSHKGQVMPRDAVERRTEKLRGQTRSDESRRKMSEARKGVPWTDTQRSVLLESFKNRQFKVKCKICGKEFISSGPRTKYCNECKERM